MKAKLIKKLRKKTNYFDVQGAVGSFGFTNRSSLSNRRTPFKGHKVTVLARNPSEAVLRARKRGYFMDKTFNNDCSVKQLAKFRVKLSSATPHWSNIIYFE